LGPIDKASPYLRAPVPIPDVDSSRVQSLRRVGL
jgi:hypothetical protein